MADLGSKEPLSHESENSFVILGLGSFSSREQNESPEPCSDMAKTIQSSSTVFAVGDSEGRESNEASRFSLSESIQEKLNELAKENSQLKETLSQNNLAIKSQLDTFFMWQQEVLKTHETHKRKFLETKDLILKLRSENISMKKQLDELIHGTAVPGGVPASENLPIKKFDDLESENKKFESCGFCSELFSKNECLYNENQRLVKEIEKVRNEKLKIQKELEDALLENLLLKQRNANMQKSSEESLSYKSLPNAEARAQISNLLKQLEEEKEKTQKLKEALRKAESRANGSSDANLSTTEEFNHSMRKMDDMNQSLRHQNERISNLNSWVTLAVENMKNSQGREELEGNLVSEIKGFKTQLDLEESTSKENQKNIADLQTQFTKLYNDYQILEDQFIIKCNENQKVEVLKEEIMDLTNELQNKKEELASKQQECDDLKKEMERLKTEWENKVKVLEVQVEVYQTDFNSERAARQRITDEKEQLAEQVRFLLNEFVKSGKEIPLENSRQERSPLESPGRKPTYICPKCMASFPALRDCEEHLDDCLSIHMYP